MALTKIPRGLLDTGIADSSDATAITIDSSENVTISGNLNATLTTAAQPNITSVGTLSALTVDNLGINGNTITANSGALNITPASGSAIVLDGTINVDAGVVTGATSITSTAFVGTTASFIKASSGASATSGTVLTVEDDDNTELSILGGSSSVLAINFGHSGDNDEGKITFNTTSGSEDLQIVSSKEITLDAAGVIKLDADGGELQFLDGGTAIGSIAAHTGSLIIGGGDVGIGFYQGANALVPYNGVSALRDSAIDLGMASSGRFKDLYLSGWIYAGGNVDIGTTVGTSKVNIYTGNVTGAGTLASSAINIAHTTHTNGMSQMTFGYQPGSLTYAAAYIGYIGVSQAGYGNGALVFGTRTATSDTQPSERMRIDSAGAAYFMTTNDMSGDVNVNGASGVAIGGANDQGYYRRIYTNYSSGASLYFWNGSNQGELNSNGVWTDASDVALKKDIADIEYGLETVKKLKPRKYKMKSDNSNQIGFVAQEVESEVPEVVTTGENPDGVEQKSLAYGHLVAVLTKALQEALTRIEALEAK